MATIRRIHKEVEMIKQSDSKEFIAVPNKDDIFTWSAILKYKGTDYHLEMQLPDDYPFKPPRVRFLTPISCKYVEPDGRICLDILSRTWSPALTIEKVLLSILSLLEEATTRKQRTVVFKEIALGM